MQQEVVKTPYTKEVEVYFMSSGKFTLRHPVVSALRRALKGRRVHPHYDIS